MTQTDTRPDAQPLALNRRERDTLQLVAEGLSSRKIAAQLCYSTDTINSRLRSLSLRFGTSNRTDTVAFARRRGWL